VYAPGVAPVRPSGKTSAQLDAEIAEALGGGKASRATVPTALKKTYVMVRTRAVAGRRGADAGFEAKLIEPGAMTLFDLFHLTKLNPNGTVNYAKAIHEHGDAWAAWDARSGKVHGVIRPRLRQGRYDTEEDVRDAAIDLARKRGYVIVDGDLIRAGLPIDEAT
jgi:hypothetical protein